MKELRVAIQGKSKGDLIQGLKAALRIMEQNSGQIPVFNSGEGYKIRTWIIDNAEHSNSFDEEIDLTSKGLIKCHK